MRPQAALTWIKAMACLHAVMCLGRMPNISGNMMNLSGLQRSPLDLIEHEHAQNMRLCDLLEQIADGLPGDVDRRRCREAASALRYQLPLNHQDEEKGLFPLLRARAGASQNLDAILSRLASEHAADESFAGELTEELDHLAATGEARNPEVLGYMLRGFFESYRRHIQWEDTILLPLARQILTDEELKQLSAAMASHRIQA